MSESDASYHSDSEPEKSGQGSDSEVRENIFVIEYSNYDLLDCKIY